MIRTGKTMFVASTGGHLHQLHSLAQRLEPDPRSRTWVTFDSPQSRSLLRGEDVTYVPEIHPRDYMGVAARYLRSLGTLRAVRPIHVVSTGSAIALAVLPAARSLGIAATYIESAARVDGPSATGRLLSRVPGVRLFTQYLANETPKWKYGFSVFEQYTAGPVQRRLLDARDVRVLVMLGTLDFPFDRLVSRVLELLPDGAEVAWQLGSTSAPAGLPGAAFDLISAEELAALASRATVVVSHSGCGSALTALESGVHPILVPRRVHEGEHIDDHQVQIGRKLEAQRVAVVREVPELDPMDLLTDWRIRDVAQD